MSRLRVNCFAMSVDGFGAGPNQSLENPLGVGGLNLHQWFFRTQVFQQRHGKGEGTTGVDNDFAARGFDGIGAWILGRNMFGPVRGPWPNEDWKGWWGSNPPYHSDVFVLTHHQREPIVMEGGTTFYFVMEGNEVAWEWAKAAPAGVEVRLGGGPATPRQYLKAGLVDEMHVVIRAVALGSGEPLFAGLDLVGLGYECKEHAATEAAMHVVFRKG